jgi:hypothetical protein
MNPGYPQQGAPPPGYPPQGYPPPGYGYPPGPPPPPQKKGMSGCLIAALVVGGLVLLGIIAFIVVVVVIAKKAVGIAQEGMNAPGSAEVRALGCDVGMVTDLSKVGSMFGLDAGAFQGSTQVMVICQMASPQKTAPTCKEVAQAYMKAVTPPGRFTVQVSANGRQQPYCQEIFSEKGVHLGTGI